MTFRISLVFLIGVAILYAGLVHGETLGDYTSHEVNDSSVVVWAGSAAVMLTPYAEDVLRVSIHPDGNIVLDSSLVVVQELGDVAFTAVVVENSLTMTAGSFVVQAELDPVRFSYFADGMLAVEDEDGFNWNGDQRGVRFEMPLTDAFYGCGERASSMNHRGQRLDSYNQAHYCYGEGAENLNITIPFVLSSGGWGIYFEGNYPGVFDFGATDATVFEYSLEHGPISFYLIAGGEPEEVMANYVTLTGHAPLPPRWALGYIQSRYGYQSEQHARSVVSTFRTMGIPLDALVLDLYWFGWGEMGDFRWDFGAFPTPQNMMADFAAQGVKTVLITEPYVVTTSENFSPASSWGYLCKDENEETYVLENFWAGNAGLIDITNLDARDWWWEFYEIRTNEGVGGWWSDLGEPENHPYDMQHQSGPANSVHNIYSLQWAKMLYEGYQEHFPNQRLFNLIRSGYAGMQRYGTFPWSGDVQRSFSGLRAQLPIMLNMGLSGVGYTGSDLGGFDCGELDDDLYTRWMQMGAFSPVMRAHGVGVFTEPIYFGEPTRTIVTDFIKLRYQLLPYNNTLAYFQSARGTPLARPMFWEFDDPGLQDCSDQYMWGSSFLVAPVLEGGVTSRDVYLPQGVWINYWTDNAIEGGRTITADAPLERMPLFVKAGSIIPMAPVVQSTEDFGGDTLVLQFYPDESLPNSGYHFFLDDGVSPDAMENLEFYTYQISNTLEEDSYSTLMFRHGGGYPGAPDTVQLFCEIHRVGAQPDSVTISALNSYNLIPVETMAEYHATDSCYLYSEEESILRARFKWNGDALVFDVEGMALLDAQAEPSTQPTDFRLMANYPNPFNAETTIRFELPKSDNVSLEVYDIQGRRVTTLLAEARLSGGYHELTFDGSGLASGVYFYRLKTANYEQCRKMVLLK